jgi:hypothetical protein
MTVIHPSLVAFFGPSILGVDPQPISTGFALDVDPSFVESEFMPEYEAAFGDERAKDSADDRPVPELSKRDKALLQRVVVVVDDDFCFQFFSTAYKNV